MSLPSKTPELQHILQKASLGLNQAALKPFLRPGFCSALRRPNYPANVFETFQVYVYWRYGQITITPFNLFWGAEPLQVRP